MPSSTHWQWSLPEEKLQRPESRYPPSTSTSVPVGAYDDDTSASGVSFHTSSCARSSNSEICHGCTPTTAATQPVEGHADARARTVSYSAAGLAS
ncbi:Uncharacterised protein [Mycobacteroides abscessus subsp. abscessus]|nr:Uncharacterised protein [Mycobacteroides abscessus subsp. abscessus]